MSATQERKGFEPAKARWLPVLASIMLGLMELKWIWRLSDGDWAPILRAVPATLALMAAMLGGFILIGFLIELVRTRRWPNLDDAKPRFGWPGWAGGLVLFFLYAMHLCVDDAPWSSLGDGFARAVSHLAADWTSAAALGGFLLFFLAINWWLGFSERDHARALDRDRQNRLRGGEPS